MVTRRDLANRKLATVPVGALRELARELGVDHRGRQGDIASRLVNQDTAAIDAFIRRKYRERVRTRQENVISDADLIAELNRVPGIAWGVEQGQLDGKIQREYVRRYPRYNDLIAGIQATLHGEITNYAVASWYNHWATVLIEDHIGQHPNVVPTIKNVAGVDLFFRDHPFDLKITYLPRTYQANAEDAIADPAGLARWLYENQGAQRFGADNRFYVVLIDRADVAQSWRLKRDVALLYQRIDDFLNDATVDDADDLQFVYNGRHYVPRCKMLIISR